MITIQDVKDYLATLRMDDVAGVAGSTASCPVARAGRWKYGVDFSVTATAHQADAAGIAETPNPPEIAGLIQRVDWYVKDGFSFSWVTRAQVESCIQAMEKEEQHG